MKTSSDWIEFMKMI